ncbi:MAG TPA: hypothetical protein VMD53_07310 [Rhizomicrobium sp.]|nr:hypothetical protein [Rhizomicrobium sp.]
MVKTAIAITTVDGPSLERANPGFDTRNGNGGETLWLPLKP